MITPPTLQRAFMPAPAHDRQCSQCGGGMRGGGEGRARVQERREGKRERAGGELLDRAADVASIQSLSRCVGPAEPVAADSL